MRQSAGPRPGLCRRRWAGASALDMLAGDGGAAGPGPPLESGGLRGTRARPQPAGQRPQRGERKAGRPESTDSHPTSSVQHLPFCVTAHPGVTPPAHAVWAPESTPRPQTPRGWGQVGCPTQPRPRCISTERKGVTCESRGTRFQRALCLPRQPGDRNAVRASRSSPATPGPLLPGAVQLPTEAIRILGHRLSCHPNLRDPSGPTRYAPHAEPGLADRP